MSAAPAAASPPRRVVICGGGVVGACTAYFLSTHAGSPTVPTLVEKCAPACAASGKPGSVLVPTHPKPASASASASPPHPRLPPWVDPSASVAPPRELGIPDTTAQVHPGLFTKAVLAVQGAEVVIGEVERVVARDDRVAGVVVKGREAVVDADAVMLALGPWSGRLEVVSEVFDVSGIKAHSIVLRPREPDKITPHCLFLSYQPEPGAKPSAVRLSEEREGAAGSERRGSVRPG